MSGLNELGGRIEAALAHEGVRVRSALPLAGGACQDNLLLDLDVIGQPRRLVLRSDPTTWLPGSLTRRQEFPVIQAALAAGVRTPAVRWLCEDLVRPGASAYFMDFAPGVAIGRQVLRSPELAAAREGLLDELASELAKVHSIRLDEHPELPIGALGVALDGDPVDAALRFARGMVDEMHEPHPALELAIGWLHAHRPAVHEIVLVHGDFRTGNFLLVPDGLSAVLDWEFAHWGVPAEDLAWLCVRDWRFGAIDRAAGGFASRADLFHAYERESGRTIDPREVHWWEVMGNVRWAAGSVYQGERYLGGQASDIELIAIARRAAEMEYEALRLIETGE